jgi:formylglycine-generating enzyme required for sulfatase activity
VNNWGLINYVGNVDELVKTDNGYLLAGGNFSDSISDCKISLEKPFTTHNSSVGFRLVRNLE